MKKRIINALKEDAISIALDTSFQFLIGLPLPVSTLEELFKMAAAGMAEPNFVDWEMKNWWQLYHQEVARTQELFYQGNRVKLPQVVILDNTRHQRPLEKFEFLLLPDAEDFVLPNKYKGLTEHAFQKLYKAKSKKGTFKNEKNVRLIAVSGEDPVRLTCQCVYYEDYLRTNLCLDFKATKQVDSLREILHGQGRLEDLADSPLANNLGINILFLTADGKLVIQRRSDKVAFRKREFAPSASGTIKESDIPLEGTPVNGALLRKYFLTEAKEELGIDARHVTELSFLGATRELIRGGEPELFFSGRFDLTETDILTLWKNAKDKEESKEILFVDFGNILLDKPAFDHADVQKFGLQADAILDRLLENASIPLVSNFAFWCNYVLAAKTRKD